MRNGFLCGLLLLLGARTAHAQTWPAYQGYPMPYPPPGYAAYGPPPGAWPMMTPPPYYATPAPVPRVPLAVPPRPTPASTMRPTSLPDPQVAPAKAQTESAPTEPVETPAEAPTEPSAPAVPLDVPATEAAPAIPAILPGDTYARPHHEKFWINGGYLAAWLKQAQISVPLLTTGDANNAPPGALGQPGTAILFGNDSVNYGTFHGGWFELGFWLDPENRCSLDLGGFFLAPQHVQYSAASDPSGNPVLTRPVFSLTGQSEAAFVDALPGTAAGASLIDVRSLLLGGEVNTRYHWYLFRRLHADALIGFRTLHFEEGLDIQDRIQPLTANSLSFIGQAANPPSVLTDLDHFKTLNTFYGAQFGGRLRWEHELGFVDVFGKVGVGVNSQIVNIFGVSNLISPTGAAAAAPGGILALPSNIGEHSRRQFGYTREAGVNFGADVHPHLRVKVGYSFLSWSGVTRVGDALDRVVNPRQVPTDQAFGALGGGARPTFIFADETLWVHFLNVGMEFHW